MAMEATATTVSTADALQQTLDADTLARLRSACCQSLFFLARGVLGFKDLTPHVHKPICEMLQRYEANRRRLVVFPRSWFKSSVASVAYPIWRAINNPNVRILIVQNSFSNAKKKISEIRQLWEKNALLRVLFPELLPTTSGTWSDECLTLNRTLTAPEGTFEPAGTGTAVTSRHYDEIIEDDTVAPDYDAMTGEIQQPTAAEIEKAIGFHKMCHPLLVHPTQSVITIVGTRWAIEDLIGWIKRHCPEYVVSSRSILEDLNGNPASEDQGGVPVWDRFGIDAIRELRASIGTLMFEMLYMNNPSSSVNTTFKRSMVRYYDTLGTSLVYCTSVDLASAKPSRTSDPDYTVVLTTAIQPSTGRVFVVHYNRGRVDPGETIAWVFNHWRCYKPMVIRIESTGYQATLKYWIEQRQKETGELFYVEPVPHAGITKAARIMGMEPWFASGRIALRVDMSDLERELLAFDKDRIGLGHDDVIDALSMHVPFWSQSTENWRREKEAQETIDPFSGRSVVDELLGRATLLTSYPYDVGLLGQRLKSSQLREYVAAEPVEIN